MSLDRLDSLILVAESLQLRAPFSSVIALKVM